MRDKSRLIYLSRAFLYFWTAFLLLSTWMYGATNLHIFQNFPPNIESAYAATENKYADGHISGTFTNPTNAHGAANATWAGVVNENTSQTSRWSMENPSSSLTGTQTIQVYARKGSNSGTPTISVNLYENGTLVQNVIATTDVTSTSGQTLSGTFNASVITNANDVQIEVVATAAGGSPSARNAAQVDSITWVVDLANPTTTLATGSDPASTTVAPSASIVDSGAFTFTTNTGTDSITALTVSLSGSGTPYDGVSEVRITSDNGSTTYFSAISSPVSNTLNFSGGTPIPASASSVQFKIRITPKTHANMPAPAGASYALQPQVTAFTSTNGQAGSDTNANTLTIDNLSPAEVTGASATPDSEFVIVGWTNPADADFSEVVILRKATSSISDVPVEGTQYTAGNTIGSSTVCYVGGTSTQNCTGLTNGTIYYFKIFTKDSRGNYSASGVEVSATPATSGITISGTVYSDEGSTTMVGTQTVRIKVNGAGDYSGTLSSGAYSISNITVSAAGDVITVFLDGASEKAVTITRAADTSTAITGLNLYQNTVIVRHEDAGPITNTNLDQYDSGNDADIQFTVTTGALTVADSNKLIVWTGDTFTAGGNVTTPKMLIDGTYNLGSNTLDLTGSGASPNEPFKISGTFNADTGTVNYNGSAATIIAATTYYNLGAGTTSDVNAGVPYTLGGNTTVSNVFTLGNNSSTNNDSFPYSGYTLNLTGSGTPVVKSSKTSAGLGNVDYNGSSATNVASEVYSNLGIGTTADANAGVNYTLLGNVTINTSITIGNASSTNSDTLVIGTRNLNFNAGGTPLVITTKGILNAGTGTVSYVASSANIAAATYYTLNIGTTGDTAYTYTLTGDITANTILLGNASATTTDTLVQGPYNITTTGTGTVVTVTSKGIWSNTSTGDVILSGDVSNAGVIILNSNNGAQCVDGTDDIVITSSVGATQRTWSGAGTFTIYNVNATDQAGTITTHTSTLSNSTWTSANCGITISGTVYSDEGSTTMVGTQTVRIKVNGAGDYSGTLSSGAYSISNITVSAAGDVITVFLDGASEKAVTITRAADTSTAITGLNLYQNTAIVRHEDAGPITNTNLDQYDSGNDADIQFTVTTGALTVADSNKLIVWTGDTFTAGGNVTTPKMLIDGTYNRESNNLYLTGVGTGSDRPLIVNGTNSGAAGSVVYSGDGNTDVGIAGLGTGIAIMELAPTLTANRVYNLLSQTMTTLYINPTAASAYNLTVNLTVGFQASTIVEGLGSATATLDTTSSNYNLTSNALYINAGATLKANGSTVSVTGSASSFVLSGSFQPDTSTFSYYNLTSAQNVVGTTYYNLSQLKSSGTNTLTGNVVVNNNLTVSGGTLNLSTFNLTVTGTTSISGILDDTSTTGTNVFVGAITINSGGSMFPARNSSATVRGGITNNGTFSVGTGTWTFNTTASQAIGGTNTLTFGGIISVSSGITLTNNGTITMTGTTTGRLAGAGTFTNGTGATLNYAGSTITTTTVNFSSNENTVNYSSTSVAQTVRATTYRHLVITKSATTATLGGATTISNSLTITSGTLSLSTQDFTMSSGATINISGTLSDNSTTGTNNINGNVTINSGGTWDVDVTAINFNIAGSIVNNGSFYGGGGIYTFNTTNSSLSGSGTFVFRGTISISSGITLTNNGTITMMASSADILTGAGTFVNGGNATINYTGLTISVGTFTATASGNTVKYNSTTSAQTVLGTTYYNLIIDKTGQIATLSANTTVENDLTITAGTLTSNASGTLTIQGDLTNNGTFTHNDGTVVIAGTGTSQITGSSNTTFYNFTSTVAGKTIQFKAANTHTIAGTFTITGAEGNLINITSDTGAAQWLAYFNNPQSAVTYANISWAGCGGGSSEVTLDNTSTDGTNNGACWVFDLGLVISGTVYSDEGVTTMVGTQTVRAKVNGAGDYTGTLTDGTYSIPQVVVGAGGDVITVFLDGAIEKAVAVTVAADAVSSISNLDLYQDYILISHQSNGTVTNTNLSQYDSASDADIPFTVSAGNLSLASGAGLWVGSGATYNPGGNVTLINGGVLGSGVISMSSGIFTVDGSSDFGGSSNWSFDDLVFGDGVGADVSTVVGIGEIEVNGVLTVTTNHTLNGSGGVFNFTTSGTPFVVDGAFTAGTSTVKYSVGATSQVNVTPVDYYNLTLGPDAADAPIYIMGITTGQAIAVANNLELTGGTIDLNTNDVDLTVSNLTIAGTLLASGTASLEITGDFTNNGTFTHNNGSVTITPTNTSAITGSSSTTFYDLSSSAEGKTIEFKNGQEVAIAGTLSLGGSATNPIYLTSSQNGSQWLLNLTGDTSVNNVGVSDGGCAEGTLPVPRKLRIYNLGNNGSCWVFFAFSASFGPTDGGPGGAGVVGGGGAGGGGGGGETSTDGGPGGEGAESGGELSGGGGEPAP